MPTLRSFEVKFTVFYYYWLVVYRSGGYIEAVNRCAKESMALAAEEVKAMPHYSLEGEVIS